MARNDIVVLHVKLSRLELAETAQDWDSLFLFSKLEQFWIQAQKLLATTITSSAWFNTTQRSWQRPSFQMGPVSYAFILFHSYTKLCSFDVIWIESWFMNSSKTSICCVQNIQSVHDTRD